MYAVTAMRHGTTSDSYRYSDQVPTFYLKAQGIADESHAIEVATEILGGGELSIRAIKVDV